MRYRATSTNWVHSLSRMRSMWTTSVLGQTESNLPQVLQELGIAGDRNLAAWTRTDMSSPNETDNYERWTCMEWCGCSCHRRCCQWGDPRFRAGSRHNEISGTHSIGRRASRYSDNLNLWGVKGEIAITDSPRLCSARGSAWISRVWWCLREFSAAYVSPEGDAHIPMAVIVCGG